jgi:hypothetical protein
MSRGALAGMAAAGVWAIAAPVLRRIFRTRYSDVRLLGAWITTGPLWWPLGLAFHLVNGAVFGEVFERRGGRGWRQGVLAAQIENIALWPGMVIADRAHPDRRSGAWPPLLRNRRVFAYEVATHALFGAVLGALVRDD